MEEQGAMLGIAASSRIIRYKRKVDKHRYYDVLIVTSFIYLIDDITYLGK